MPWCQFMILWHERDSTMSRASGRIPVSWASKLQGIRLMECLILRFSITFTLFMRDLPPLFSFLFTKSWELSAKNGHQKTGKVHQVSKVTAAVTQYFSTTTTLQKLVLQNLVLSPHVKIYIKEKEKLCAQWLLPWNYFWWSEFWVIGNQGMTIERFSSLEKACQPNHTGLKSS